ncbi:MULTISPECIES: transposase [unclassified Undibacterium]|uniref:transposase n=1 Tax=unclassified Undibacterium TaxID=2630295 RepID=UPI002AC8E5BF|nr:MULTISPECIES: transposase [unclassified Undibacterium]MEB0139709.1 transposase [Undibacterium sp. CCC2.1]MEB0172590.1 transposase [Undibacterium sp. CCC1.1]MEB0176429.1 transposase [Undibacterium sp. CCC3.4]MEB0215713.1 transposase [Undibacterium sp. 5I2]WPX45139.1 transposase [Undibacterium sp. CCC3.4]
MARLPRLLIPHALHHVMQSSHDGLRLFRDDDDHIVFLASLLQGARHFGIAIHAYVLMPDHFHLLVTPQEATSLSKLMQWLGRYYVPHFNRKYLRSGSLWQGRYKATVLDPSLYFFPCSLYIESNPVRAGLVSDAAAYQWSSYAHHIGLRNDALVADHPLFWAMGNTPFQREANYKHLLEQGITEQQLALLREATHKAWLLGSASFEAEMAKLTARRLQPHKRGRPRKLVSPA